jgi:DNA polymerase III subunit delta
VPAKKSQQPGQSYPIHVIVGTDEGMVREQALLLWRELTGGEEEGFNHEIVEGNSLKVDDALSILGRLLQSLMTYSMFGGDKVVWLRNANFFGSDRTSDSESVLNEVISFTQQLEKGLPEKVTLIISANKIDKRRAFWKFLEKHAVIQVHDRIDMSQPGWEEQVASLVKNRAREKELVFEEEALDLFINLAGEATQQISNELEKLHLYLGDRKQITVEDVRLMVPLSREGVIFETGRALQAGNAARAIELIDEQLEMGESAVAIIRASIIPTVRNLFMARLVMDLAQSAARSYNDFQTAVNRLPADKKAWLPKKKSGDGYNLYPIFMSASGAQSFSLQSLEAIMHASARADKMLVSTGLDDRMILHRLVTEIATYAKPARAARAR